MNQRDMFVEEQKRKKTASLEIISLAAALDMPEVATNDDAIAFFGVCMERGEAELEETLSFLRKKHADKPPVSREMRQQLMQAGIARNAERAEAERNRSRRG